MTPQEFKEKYIDEDGWVETGGDVSLVEVGDSVVEHKHVYSTNVYGVDGEYFAVDYIKSNSGYWNDFGEEPSPPEVRKVAPILVAKTDWVNIENS